MSNKEMNKIEETEEKGFWKSLGIVDYIELIVWLFVISAGIYSLVEYFN
jgi:hypothetical protein